MSLDTLAALATVVGVLVTPLVIWQFFKGARDPSTKISESKGLFQARMDELVSNEGALIRLANERYSGEHLSQLQPLIARPEWVPAKPVPIDRIKASLTLSRRGPDGAQFEPPKEIIRLLPLNSAGKPYTRLSAAIGKYARPNKFDNNVSYTILAVGSENGVPSFECATAKYFDFIDTARALVFEYAVATDDNGKTDQSKLQYRSTIKDPTDLSARLVTPSVNTLTIRLDSKTRTPTFYLLKRSEKVAVAAGVHGVIPAGMFQPASLSPQGLRGDCNLWRNIQREYNEEFLGAEDATGGSGKAIDYDHDGPYCDFKAGLASGQLRAYYLGMGIDPLSLTADLLTVVVFEDSLFDEIFARTLEKGEEGVIVGHKGSGLPLTPRAIDEYLNKQKISIGAGAEACIRAALAHLDELIPS